MKIFEQYFRNSRNSLKTELETNGTRHGFADAITVWINKPHVVNRRLCGAKLLSLKFISNISHLEAHLTEILQKYTENKFVVNDNSDSVFSGELSEVPSLSDISDFELVIVVRDLLPKQTEKQVGREVVVYDFQKDAVVFLPFEELPHLLKGDNFEENDVNQMCYQLSFDKCESDQARITLDMYTHQDKPSETMSVSFDWMKSTLLKKIANWSCESKLKTSVTSLRLLPIDLYNGLYSELKEKYGKKFVKIWPEKTDPQKFVYEDVAIAAYLLLLWQMDRKEKNLTEKQSFVDLGCGNGLLVHILSSEGHPGIGLDLRKRNIWDLYGEETDLQVKTIIPSFENTFPEYDWLIGNHSDELTPWIPVIASRSSHHCCYFVIPCCHYDFDRKFSHKEAAESNYRSYLNFVQEVGEVCGFNVEEDTLRIPSTKRVCFIGRKRNYDVERKCEIDLRISDYIQLRCRKKCETEDCDREKPKQPEIKRQKLADTEQWSASFQPRESVEKSKNCKTIDKNITNRIVHTVFKTLLYCKDCETRTLSDGRIWRKGGIMPMSEVVKLLDKSTLKELKSECGGLQTLLRNHNSVFQVSGGQVQLRDQSMDCPYSRHSKLSKKDKTQYFKTIQCWFYQNHPDGCPKTGDICTFAHGEKDLKPRMDQTQ